MQDVLGAQQHLDRAIQRQMDFLAGDDDVVLPARVVRVHAKRVGRRDKARVRGAELAAPAGKAKAPLPLLAHHLQDHGVDGRAHVLRIDEQARRKQRNHPKCGARDQPQLQLAVLRLIGRARAVAMAVAPDDVGDEQVDDDEEDAGDDQCDGQRVVHLLPVGGKRRRPPRAHEMEEHRSNDDDHDCNGYRHTDPPPCVQKVRTYIKAVNYTQG